MTTAEITDIPSEELEAWLNGEIEKSCELQHLWPVSRTCGLKASWLMYYKMRCEHREQPGSCFICNYCYMLAKNLPHLIKCSMCETPLEIRFLERIR